jgi:UDPglucose 6-dehydrogenase
MAYNKERLKAYNARYYRENKERIYAAREALKLWRQRYTISQEQLQKLKEIRKTGNFNMKISIIGTGYVGLVTGTCLAEKGHTVTCVDLDKSKVDAINAGETPIYEPGLPEMLKGQIGKRLFATTDLKGAILTSELTFIAVGTPFDGKTIDLTFIRNCAAQIGEALRGKTTYHTVVVKSTVVPGTTDNVVRPILEQELHKHGKNFEPGFGIGMNPEFLSEGSAVHDFLNPDRIVLGGDTKRTQNALAEVYAPFSGVPMLPTSNSTAEMIKYASNALQATLISFSNEIGNLCSDLGEIDSVDVMAGVHLSQYLRSVDSKKSAPIVSFLKAGCGFGGSCFPKDVKALIAHGVRIGSDMSLLQEVIRINENQPIKMLALLKKQIKDLRGVPVAVLGLAFKPETDDIRETPALPLIDFLLAEGAEVFAYDPIAMPAAQKAFGERKITYCDSLADALRKTKALLLVTSWKEFEKIPELLNKFDDQPILIDGRRQLDKTKIKNYSGIGL